MPDPLKPSVMNDFRESLGVNTSPSFFDEKTPLTPVSLVSGNVGFPKPRTNQKLRYTTIHAGGTTTAYQISSASATQKVYLLGVMAVNNTTVAVAPALFDAISGATPSLSANTSYADETGHLVEWGLTGTAGARDTIFFPLPLEVKQGIRGNLGGATQDYTLIVYFIEENIVN